MRHFWPTTKKSAAENKSDILGCPHFLQGQVMPD